MVSPRSAITSPVSASEHGAVRRRAGVAAGAAVGLDLDGATRGHQMPDSEVRTRIRLHSSQRSTSSGGAFAMRAEVGGGQLEAAAAAAPGPQRGRADPALLGAQLLVEREQVGRHAVGDRPCAALGDLGRPPRSTSPRGCVPAAVSSVGAARRSRRARSLSRACSACAVLEPLHDLELGVLEVGDPAVAARPARAASARGPWGW